MNDDVATSTPASAAKALLAGALAALLASACCIGPLVLVLLGVSGAWIGNFAALEPYQPIFIAASVAALFFAARRIWRPVDCGPHKVCATAPAARAQKAIFGLVVLVLIASSGFPLIAPLFY